MWEIRGEKTDPYPLQKSQVIVSSITIFIYHGTSKVVQKISQYFFVNKYIFTTSEENVQCCGWSPRCCYVIGWLLGGYLLAQMKKKKSPYPKSLFQTDSKKLIFLTIQLIARVKTRVILVFQFVHYCNREILLQNESHF